jgi:hypothetical protein
MEHDAWFFIGIFVFIFLIWIATGGPLRSVAFNVPKVPETSIGTISKTGTSTPLQFPRAPYGIGNTHTSLTGSSNSTGYYGGSGTSGSGSLTTATNPLSSGVPGVFLAPPSPYRNVVSMGGYIANASSSDPRTEYLQIRVAQNASAPVNITNWILRSGASGNAESIPRGTKVPNSGVVNAAEDIVLQPGESAIIISGKSPVGASFRENKCIGYFGSFQKFTPALPQNCPSASSELSSFYGTPYIHDPSCIEYTNTLPRCKTAVIGSSSKLSLTCQEFLETHMNYNGCLAVHRGDSDFNGTTWHIYLGRKYPLWRTKYEVVELLDNQGKTVAFFNY